MSRSSTSRPVGVAASLVAVAAQPGLALSSVLIRCFVESAATDRGEPLEIDAFGETQAHQQIFVGGFRRAQTLLALDPVTRGLDSRRARPQEI